ncbi:saccharopine dehydrogenase C-terminal domain-containing protein [Aliikangiella coralliicola]|uniref:Saccharopine dehydrogenase n=1 Tax=Aliikangiella coralliicola TaxID=2592383 RepID=A0A545U0H1_9GAMM|nr:saccharopine dehydrogenase C-terminal domain-containing protein [Aliikangiella coralliicola]TQV82961.1 saccharopine dehydrogenase [Aliikangiella coralliicola]
MANILLLGAGFVTGPLVEYLHAKNHHITVGSQFLYEAEELVGGRDRLTPLQVDVTNEAEMRELVKEADLVVSFVPFQFHVSVAKICVAEKTSMVTASYTHEDMWKLDEAAKEAGITILNEIGVDPGIDHMTAMQVIDEAHEQGSKVEALVSWCGGIPAPEANNNPLGYKFSWSPMAVLSAVSNDAYYLRRGEKKSIPGDDLLNSMRDVTLTSEMDLKGYANRDSLGYKEDYRIPEVQTLLRGTLRYAGFGPVIDSAKRVGLLSAQPFADKAPASWQELMSSLSGVEPEQLGEKLVDNQSVNDSFAWLGCFSDEQVKGNSPIEAFCNLLTDKLKYENDEQDMIVMQHRLVLVDEKGNKTFHRSTLIEKGDVGGYSAMAKTVGYPAAIAADLLLSGKITRKGVCIPVTQDIYEPVLEELEKLNIKMTEEIITSQNEESFLNHL